MGRSKVLPDTEKELKELANQLGVSIHPGADVSGGGGVLIPALQARVLQALSYRSAQRATVISIIAIAVSVPEHDYRLRGPPEMNLDHAAALVLAGWYVMVAPLVPMSVEDLRTHTVHADVNAPLPKWTTNTAFDSAEGCHEY